MRANTKTHWVLYAVGVYERENSAQPFVTAKKLADTYSDAIFQDCHAAGSPLNRLSNGEDPPLFDRKRVDRNAGWEYAYRLSDAGREELLEVGAPSELPDGGDIPPEVDSDSLSWVMGNDDPVVYVQTVSSTGEGNQRHAYESNGELFKRVCGHTASPGPVTGTDNVVEMTEEEYSHLSKRCSACINSLGIDRSDYRRSLDLDVESLMNPNQEAEPEDDGLPSAGTSAGEEVAADGGATESSTPATEMVELSYYGPGAAAMFEEKAEAAEDAGLDEIAATFRKASELADSGDLDSKMVDLLAGNLS